MTGAERGPARRRAPRAAAALLSLAAGPLLLLTTLGGCGRVGPPRQPGPPERITFPRVYPAPDPITVPSPRLAEPEPAQPDPVAILR